MISKLLKLWSRFGREPLAPASLEAPLPKLQSLPEPVRPRPALALIAYARADYFLQVFDSIAAQTIRGRPFTDFFDL